MIRSLASCLLVSIFAAHAQPIQSENDFRFIVQAGGGPTFSIIKDMFLPSNTTSAKTGVGGSLYMMWHPDHLLAIGLETGYTHVSSVSFTNNDASLRLVTVPLFLLFVMEKYGISLATSVGWHRYIISANGEDLSSSWELGYSIGLGYMHPLTRSIGIGLEMKWYVIPERDTGILSPLLRMSYAFHY